MKKILLRESKAMRASTSQRGRFFNRWSRTRSLLLVLAMLLMATETWAQNGWDAVYHQTKTTSDDWTPLNEGSTTGKVLGAEKTTTYYYVTRSLNFTNSNAGGSGLTILGTVYLYLPEGIHINCVGANASDATGAGAGIELSEGNTLHLVGGGKGNYVEATGGNAANGGNGGNGTNADCVYGTKSLCGAGGNGGNGGGGAGAGIGSRGGDGGAGGAGGAGSDWIKNDGNSSNKDATQGSAGSAGATASKMGKLYVEQTFGIEVKATGGAKASSDGAGGKCGISYIDDAGNNYGTCGGGGGGAGGYGGAASNIGTGGPGGGGGGGGNGGGKDNKASGYYSIYAWAGHGGYNADGNQAPDGSTAACDPNFLKADLCYSNSTWADDDWDGGRHINIFGQYSTYNGGGNCGNAASNDVVNAGQPVEYNITLNAIKSIVDPKDSLAKSITVKYSPASGTTVILPKNVEGYQWAIHVYGKFCGLEGAEVSQFAKENKDFFGGNFEEETKRTILLKDVYGDITFQEVRATCILKSDGDNKEAINDFFDNPSVASQSYPVTVRLKDRTIYRDKKWNTICLPFDMTPAQISDSPLAGALIYKMDEVNTGYYENGQNVPVENYRADHPVLFLSFVNVYPETNGLKRGKPYLVKWTAKSKNLVDNSSGNVDSSGNKLEESSDNKNKEVEIVHQLDFKNVRVQEKVPGSWYCNDVSFQGTFSLSEELEAGDQTNLILGPKNKLYYPSETINVGACRGYFIIPDEAVETVKTRGIVMGFDDDETTGIQMVHITPEMQDDASGYYNLSGQRLNAPQKGINIIKGKKVVIK